MTNRQRSSALDKVLAVLEAVADRAHAVGLPDLVIQLGLPRGTVHRVLSQAVDRGLLLRDPARERYSIGPRLSKLALTVLSATNQAAPIRAILAGLVEELEETCNIGVLDGLDYYYLARIECEWPLRSHLIAGSRLSAHCISGGKMLLAHLDAPTLHRLLNHRKLEQCTPRTITRAPELKAELVRIKARGYSLNNQEFQDGVVGAAVPIMDCAGRAIAALAVHGPKVRVSLKRCESYVPRLQRAATRLARVWISE